VPDAAVARERSTSRTAHDDETGEIARLLERGLDALRSAGERSALEDFEQAGRLAAAAQGKVRELGLAAAGTGGFWVHEQRDPVLQALVESWRRTALDGIDRNSLLSLRLQARQAAEADYETGEHDQIMDVLEEARCRRSARRKGRRQQGLGRYI
jgi:hypothetical protein